MSVHVRAWQKAYRGMVSDSYHEVAKTEMIDDAPVAEIRYSRQVMDRGHDRPD